MRFDQRNWASIELGLHCTFGRPSGFRTETQKKNESIFIGRRHSGTPFSFIVLRHRSFFYLKKKGSFLVFIHHSTFLGSSNAVGNGDVEPKFVGFVEFSQRTLASAAFSNFRAFSTHAHDATLTGVGGGGLDAAPVTHQTFPGLPRFSLALSAAENTTPRPTNPTHRLEIHILRLDGGLYSGANGFGVMRSVLQPDWHGFTFEHILIIDISRERSI